MDLFENVGELRQAAEYRRAVKILRGAGWGAIIFGVLALVIGVPAAVTHPINFVLVLFGLGLLAEGLWNLLLPTAEGILVDGILLLICALWNLFITILSVAAHDPPSVFWAVLGGFQIAWAVSRFVSYGRFRNALAEKPDAETLERLEDIVKDIKQTKSVDDNEIVGFRSRSALKQQDWKGRLGDDAAIFVDKLGYDILVAYKEDVTITVKGKTLLASTLNASIKVGKQRMEATISPESFARYTDWKQAEVPTVELADDEAQEGISEKPRRPAPPTDIRP